MDGKDRQELSGSEVNHHDPTPEGFWKWAYSNILINVTRGVFAEYLVALALGLVERSDRQVWEDYDLCYKGIKIEVKSSAYVQVWNEEHKLSTPEFRISSRKCDVYVFCLLAEKKKRETDPLNLSQWKFCVVDIGTIKKLDKGKEKPQKTIRKGPIEKRLGGNWIEYSELKGAIKQYVK